MRIRSLRLAAADVPRLADFYSGVLGLPLIEPTAPGGPAVLQAGSTRLTFRPRPAAEMAPYHFAFNVTPRKFPEAKDWLATRVSLLTEGGSEVYHFTSWNAEAVYFLDPVGNVAELIARYDLPDDAPGQFGPADILSVSEIGVVVPDVPAFVAAVHDRLGIAAYRPGSAEFAPVGDEHGLLIVARVGRPWMTAKIPARPLPIEMEVEAPIVDRYDLPELGYRITSVGSPPRRT